MALLEKTFRSRAVGGFGKVPNVTATAEPYSHGLSGVNQSGNWLFINILVVSFMVLLSCTLLYRWLNICRSHMRHLLTMGRESDQRYWMYDRSPFWPWLKRHVLYAPLGRVRHNKEIQLSQAITIGTLPSRLHMLLLLAYLASNIAYCLVLDWRRLNSASVVAELRGRSGALAAFNLVPTVLFACRNNPLIPILRVSYDTFNLLHRWCARILALEVVVHFLCWLTNNVNAGGWYQVHLSLSTSGSYQGGIIGTTAFITIVLAAFSPLRHAFYETFLTSHRILVFVALIGVYVHLDKASLPQLPFVQLALTLWILEWTCRVIWIAYYNMSRQKGITRIKVQALPSEACRVTFEVTRPWRWQPGSHVHAYLPTVALWSSHPFSVAWVDGQPSPALRDIELEKLQAADQPFSQQSTERPSLSIYETSYRAKSAAIPSVAKLVGSLDKMEPASLTLPRVCNGSSVSLIMRARTGMTRRLHDKAAASPGGTLTMWGAIEGPYGGHDLLTSYGTVVLFAGGVGITYCMGYIRQLLEQYQMGISSTRKILLVWSVPNTEALEWVREWMDEILRMESRRDVLRIQLFVTKPRHRAEVVSNTGSVQMFPGRCNPQTIIEKELQARIGAMAVTVCGPGAFADSVRCSVRGVLQQGVVDFVEEAFTY